jgi:hypothetical protein
MKQLFHHQYFSTKFYRKKSLEGSWKRMQKLSRQWKSEKLKWNIAGANRVLGGVRCHWNFIFCIFIWIFLMKHGSCLRWIWQRLTSGYFPNGKEVEWKMESKYYGWLLPKSYKGDTNWRI